VGSHLLADAEHQKRARGAPIKMSETILTLGEIQLRLLELQKKYQCSGLDFTTRAEVRSRVSDEDEFEWEAYMAHADALREREAALHRDYLSHGISVSHEDENKSQAVVLLAA
jgi:hypothetical protein